MNNTAVIEHIVGWLNAYSHSSHTKGFIVGVSGGIDSALTSTLCAMTGKPTMVLEMPIYQAESQVSRAQEHMAWLKSKFPNVTEQRVELTQVFDQFMASVPKANNHEAEQLALANTRSRLRMTTLYYFAGLHGLIVAGTGNKVEDFGVGFYTKYGDGGVDVSPIADLYKTQVWDLARTLGVAQSIIDAKPTDGLWGDDRSDEDQIGASYAELEWAMEWLSQNEPSQNTELSSRQQAVIEIYQKRHRANKHKMNPIPVCLIPQVLKG